MLVISRNIGDIISIGDEIVVKVLKIRGGRVSIGIAAPRKTPVRRGTIDERPAVRPIHGTRT